MASVLFSIVIPVYNTGNLLKLCVNSLLSQLDTSCEIILVNDGSTDNSSDICDFFSRKYAHIKTINQPNSGLSSARNAGIELAQGQYIAFLDSDDFWEDHAWVDIKRILVEKHPDLIAFRYREYYPGKNMYKDVDIKLDKERVEGETQQRLCCIMQNPSFSFMACRYIIAKKLLIENQLYFKGGIYHEDEEWTPRLLCASKNFVYYPCIVLNYRQATNGSITKSRNIKKLLDKIIIATTLKAHAEASNAFKKFLGYRATTVFCSVLSECNFYKDDQRYNALKTKIEENISILDFYRSKKITIIKIVLHIFGLESLLFMLNFRLRKFVKKGAI